MKTIMKKKLLGPIILLIGITLLSYSAYALYTTLSWTQTLTVPPGSFIVYRSDGTTVINQSSDQTSIWAWYPATHSFNATVMIKNDGPAYIHVAVARPADLDLLWTWAPISTLTLASNQTLPVALSINKTLAFDNDLVGLFTINMTIVP
jgi:hypothetical protein